MSRDFIVSMKKYKAIANKVSNQYSMFHKGGNFELTLYQFSPWQLIKSFYSWLKSCWELQLVKDVVVCVRYGTFSGKRCLGSWDSLSTCKYSHFIYFTEYSSPQYFIASDGIEAALPSKETNYLDQCVLFNSFVMT